nr:hypothetical protein [Pandoravirus massiliensis]
MPPWRADGPLAHAHAFVFKAGQIFLWPDAHRSFVLRSMRQCPCMHECTASTHCPALVFCRAIRACHCCARVLVAGQKMGETASVIGAFLDPHVRRAVPFFVFRCRPFLLVSSFFFKIARKEEKQKKIQMRQEEGWQTA